MAKKDMQMEEEIIDLTELIEPGEKVNAKAARACQQAAAPEPDVGVDDDFGAIFAEKASQPAKKVDPNESLDMSDMGGIDNLLESLDIPPQPHEAATGAPAAAQDDDLDSVLDDLLGNGKPAAEKAEPTGQQAEQPPAAAADLDIDDILSSFDKPKSAKTAAGSPSPNDDLLNADLDSILADVKPPQKPVHIDSGGGAENSAGDFHPDMPKAASNPAAVGPQPGLDDDLDALLNEPTSKAAQPAAKTPQAAKEEPGLDEELDDLLNEPAPGPVAAAAPSLPVEARQEAEAAPPAPLPAWSPDALASICRNLASGQNTQTTLQDFARELGAQTAHVDDMGEQMSQLAKRLLACESKLAASRARIAALEKGMESTAALEDLLKQGTPLHAGFMSLIANAVANALKGVSLDNGSSVSALQADMQNLASAQSGLASRLDAVEKKIDELGCDEPVKNEVEKMDAMIWSSDMRLEKLEQRVAELASGECLEKAAAQAVARVLHEEITRLAQD